MKKSIPVVKGKMYPVKIMSLGHSAEGVGRVEDFTVFIPGALLGVEIGRRMADECKSTVQLQVAQEMLRNPPPSVLDDSKPATALVRK